jgi:hypothetical protein
MANTQLQIDSNKTWRWLLVLLVLLIAAAGLWWREGGKAPATVATAASAPVAGKPSLLAQLASTPLSPQYVETQIEAQQQARYDAMVVQQKEAAKVLEQQPDLKPLEGPVTERPAFVSAMEWDMLKGTWSMPCASTSSWRPGKAWPMRRTWRVAMRWLRFCCAICPTAWRRVIPIWPRRGACRLPCWPT